MRIVNRQEFLQLSAGTVYSEYEPCIFSGLYIKGDSWPNDFLYDDLIGAVENDSSEDRFHKCDRMEQGESFPVDFNYTGRDGLFDDQQLYAIYEKADVEALIKRLQDSLNPSKSNN